MDRGLSLQMDKSSEEMSKTKPEVGLQEIQGPVSISEKALDAEGRPHWKEGKKEGKTDWYTEPWTRQQKRDLLKRHTPLATTPEKWLNLRWPLQNLHLDLAVRYPELLYLPQRKLVPTTWKLPPPAVWEKTAMTALKVMKTVR
jgi:hypothetical protein